MKGEQFKLTKKANQILRQTQKMGKVSALNKARMTDMVVEISDYILTSEHRISRRLKKAFNAILEMYPYDTPNHHEPSIISRLKQAGNHDTFSGILREFLNEGERIAQETHNQMERSLFVSDATEIYLTFSYYDNGRAQTNEKFGFTLQDDKLLEHLKELISRLS